MMKKRQKIIIPESVGQDIEERYKKSPEFRRSYDEEVLLLKLAYKIVQLRKQRHITQRELAKRMGTTQQTVSRLEDSKNSKLTVHTLTRIARALNARVNIDIVPQE
jgi:DNA-binding Xre family transcriptional regulator